MEEGKERDQNWKIYFHEMFKTREVIVSWIVSEALTKPAHDISLMVCTSRRKKQRF